MINYRKAALIFLAMAIVCSLAIAKDKKKDEPLFAELHFTVLKDVNGKPIENASVILHPVDSKGNVVRGGYQLKTNKSGEARTQFVPYGTVRLQIIAPGLQTYGEDLKIEQPLHEYVIRMKPPTEQYSIYK